MTSNDIETLRSMKLCLSCLSQLLFLYHRWSASMSDPDSSQKPHRSYAASSSRAGRNVELCLHLVAALPFLRRVARPHCPSARHNIAGKYDIEDTALTMVAPVSSFVKRENGTLFSLFGSARCKSIPTIFWPAAKYRLPCHAGHSQEYLLRVEEISCTRWTGQQHRLIYKTPRRCTYPYIQQKCPRSSSLTSHAFIAAFQFRKRAESYLLTKQDDRRAAASSARQIPKLARVCPQVSQGEAACGTVV